MKLTKRHLYALKYLLSRRDAYCPQMSIPNGNGLATGGHFASSQTMNELMRAGFVEYGKDQRHSFYGYRITELGVRRVEQEMVI